MSTSRSEIVGAAIDGKIYIIGGFDENGSSTTTVETYDPMTDKWTISTPLPKPLDHTAAASFNGKLYVVGEGIWTGENCRINYLSMTPLPTNGNLVQISRVLVGHLLLTL